MTELMERTLSEAKAREGMGAEEVGPGLSSMSPQSRSMRKISREDLRQERL